MSANCSGPVEHRGSHEPKPPRSAISAACNRVETSSFRRIVLTWSFTVVVLRKSDRAMSPLEAPAANCLNTSCSRELSEHILRRTSSLSGAQARNKLRETSGERTTPPPAKVRTSAGRRSGSVSLTMKPLAPARSAAEALASVLKVVRIATVGGDSHSRSSPSTSIPLRSAICRSSSTTSTSAPRICSTASPPEVATETDMSPAPSRIILSPERIRASSSMMATLITATSPSTTLDRSRTRVATWPLNPAAWRGATRQETRLRSCRWWQHRRRTCFVPCRSGAVSLRPRLEGTAAS
ncbi:hypothetical protein MMX123_02755 [Microbacterium sp. MM2322]